MCGDLDQNNSDRAMKTNVCGRQQGSFLSSVVLFIDCLLVEKQAENVECGAMRDSRIAWCNADDGWTDSRRTSRELQTTALYNCM